MSLLQLLLSTRSEWPRATLSCRQRNPLNVRLSTTFYALLNDLPPLLLRVMDGSAINLQDFARTGPKYVSPDGVSVVTKKTIDGENVRANTMGYYDHRPLSRETKEEERLIRMTYRSELNVGVDVWRIIEHARAKNGKLMIGAGGLAGIIDQILEGSKKLVETLVTKIIADPRHSCVVFEQTEFPKKRHYSQWLVKGPLKNKKNPRRYQSLLSFEGEDLGFSIFGNYNLDSSGMPRIPSVPESLDYSFQRVDSNLLRVDSASGIMRQASHLSVDPILDQNHPLFEASASSSTDAVSSMLADFTTTNPQILPGSRRVDSIGLSTDSSPSFRHNRTSSAHGHNPQQQKPFQQQRQRRQFRIPTDARAPESFLDKDSPSSSSLHHNPINQIAAAASSSSSSPPPHVAARQRVSNGRGGGASLKKRHGSELSTPQQTLATSRPLMHINQQQQQEQQQQQRRVQQRRQELHHHHQQQNHIGAVTHQQQSNGT
eukprot:jgi/Bigna1/142655/aug1.72_g17363